MTLSFFISSFELRTGMGVYLNDEFHLFAIFSFVNIIFYLLNACHFWHRDHETIVCKIIWYGNCGLLTLEIWNYFFANVDLFNVQSGWVTFVGVILAGIFVYVTIGSTVALIQLIIVFLLFFVLLIGARNYVESFFSQQIGATSNDYIYFAIGIAGVIIIYVIYVKFIRGRRVVEIFFTDLILSFLVMNGVTVLRYEDISTGLNNTTIPVFDYDVLFWVGLVILFIAYPIIYYYTQGKDKDKEQEKETATTEPIKQIDQEQTVTISTPTPPTETSPSNENTTLLPEDESSGPTPTSTAAQMKLSRWNKFRHHRCG